MILFRYNIIPQENQLACNKLDNIQGLRVQQLGTKTANLQSEERDKITAFPLEYNFYRAAWNADVV